MSVIYFGVREYGALCAALCDVDPRRPGFDADKADADARSTAELLARLSCVNGRAHNERYSRSISKGNDSPVYGHSDAEIYGASLTFSGKTDDQTRANALMIGAMLHYNCVEAEPFTPQEKDDFFDLYKGLVSASGLFERGRFGGPLLPDSSPSDLVGELAAALRKLVDDVEDAGGTALGPALDGAAAVLAKVEGKS